MVLCPIIGIRSNRARIWRETGRKPRTGSLPLLLHPPNAVQFNPVGIRGSVNLNALLGGNLATRHPRRHPGSRNLPIHNVLCDTSSTHSGTGMDRVLGAASGTPRDSAYCEGRRSAEVQHAETVVISQERRQSVAIHSRRWPKVAVLQGYGARVVAVSGGKRHRPAAPGKPCFPRARNAPRRVGRSVSVSPWVLSSSGTSAVALLRVPRVRWRGGKQWWAQG